MVRITTAQSATRWLPMITRTVIRDAETLRQRLVTSRIARPVDIAGSLEHEITALEHKFGSLPRSYKSVLGLIGHSAGRLVDDREVWIYADQLQLVNRLAREQIFEQGTGGDDPVPKSAIFIGARFGEHPWFILTEDSADCPVWHCNTDTGRVTRIAESVWDWVEKIVRDAEYHIDEGIPEKNARRGRDTTVSPGQSKDISSRKGARSAWNTLVVSGAMLAVGLLGYYTYLELL